MAQTAADLNAAELRQHQVKDHQIRLPGQRLFQSGAAIVGGIHLIALVGQLQFQKAGDFLLVLHNENAAHGASLLRRLIDTV